MTEHDDEQHLRSLLNAGADDTGGASPAKAISVYVRVRNRVHRRRVLRGSLAVCATACLVAGVVVAASGAAGSHHPAGTEVAGPGAPTGAGRTVVLTGALQSFSGCNAYLQYVKAQALQLVGPYGLNGGNAVGVRFSPEGFDGGVASPGVATAGGSQGGAILPAASGPAALNTAPESSGAAANGSTDESTNDSQTDDQVAGVDEPDTVKTDGSMAVTLSGSVLRVLDSSAKVIGQVDIPGDSSGGILLDGTYAVVLSTTTPDDGPVGVYDPYLSSDTTPTGTPDTARVAVVDLSDPSAPALVHTFEFTGDLVGARLVDGQVRLVLETDGPQIDFANPASNTDPGTATTDNKELIEGSTLAEWLPSWQLEQPDGATTATAPLANCVSLSHPQQSAGVATASVFSLDPASTAPGPAVSVVGGGNTIYETANQVFLAGAVTDPANADPYADAVPSGCCTVTPPTSAMTRIYEFTYNASGPPTFDGAGTVPGWLVNSYAMDEDSSGRLRVASTATGSGGQTQSYITVLATSGGALTPVGSVGNIGAGEFIRAVRFVGNLAYVVTYQSFDPLYIVNLANPQHPVLAGQIDEPGFSEFLYPVSPTILVGVGVQITDGEPSGYVLATYDVSNPAAPRRIADDVLVSGYQWVAQGYDPHAFLYWAPDDLAFVATPGVNNATGVSAYRVSPTGQLTLVASLSHTGLSADRTVVVGSDAWAVTGGGVVLAALPSLASPQWVAYP